MRRALRLPIGVIALTALLASPTLSTSRGGSAAPADPGRLRACGTSLCAGDGTPFLWRGVTAFRLADLVADGRDDEARAFVAWASRQGFTVLRVLAMNHGWIDLAPEEGRRALPRVFALAREKGLYVQVVALAGTARPEFARDAFLREQVRAVADLCAQAVNCVLEIANEPYHSTQADLDEDSRLATLNKEIPPQVLAAWGAAPPRTFDAATGGEYLVAHIPRGGDRWDRVGLVTRLAALARESGRFVVDNEPIGAAERAHRSRRDDEPAAFFAQAAIGGLLDLGSTFHCEDCLQARVPGPVQQACADAFITGRAFGEARRAPDRQPAPAPCLSPDSPAMMAAVTATLNRRAFWQSLAVSLSAAAAIAQPRPAGSATAELADLLSLRGDEVKWLDSLTAPQQAALLSGLRTSGRPSRQVVDLLHRVLGRRERLFAYVGYPPLPNRLTACDGLIRE